MSEKHDEALQTLRSLVQKNRVRIRSFRERTEPQATRLLTANTIAAAIATVLTGMPLVGGAGLADALGPLSPGSPGWLVVSALAMAASIVGIITSRVYRELDFTQRLARAQAADARLAGLEAALDTGHVTVDDALEQIGQCLPEIGFIPDGSLGKPAPDRVTGAIESPAGGREVSRSLRCSGWAEGVGPGISLFLVVETADGRIWPKEGEVVVEDDGRWRANVFEDGAAEEFSLGLYAAGPAAARRVRRWIRAGQEHGSYREVKGIRGAHRVARVDGLRIARTDQAHRPATQRPRAATS